MADFASLPADPFTPAYPDILETTFLRARPKSEFMYNWNMFQTLYESAPERFRVISGLHSNELTDPLHYSVEVTGAFNWKTRLHVYGYWKSHFVITHVTRLEREGPVTLAEFCL